MDDSVSNADDTPSDAASRNEDVHKEETYEALDTDSDLDMQDEDGGLDVPATVKSPKSRLFHIQVILRPPPDPTQYERIEPSRTAERILDEIEIDGEVFHSVEFEDGHIEQSVYDDTLELLNGPGALQQFRNQGFSNTILDSRDNKRHLPEDDYHDTESSNSNHASKLRRVSAEPIRRSARQTSRHTSAGRGHEVNGFDLDDSILDDEAEEAESYAKSSTNKLSSFANHRMTRSKVPKQGSQHAQDDSEDELAQDPKSSQQDDSDDYIPIVRSDIAGKAGVSSRRRRKHKTLFSTKGPGDGSDIELVPLRKSTRSTKTLKNMEDPPLDDSNDVVEETAPVVPKYAAVKEVFKEPTEEFRTWHSDVCDTCQSETNDGSGALICCQGCSNSYHKQCISSRAQRDHRVTKIGQDEFVLQCRFCIGLHKKKDKSAPDYLKCQSCKIQGVSCAEFSAKKTPKQEEQARLGNGGEDPIIHVQPHRLNNPDNVLFRCSTCRRAYHFEHLPPLTASLNNSMGIRDERLNEYALAGWKCKECLGTVRKIHALVAWRPTNQGAYKKGQLNDEFNEDEMEYLVKWEKLSHLHDTWMPGAWVYGIAAPASRTSFHKREGNRLPKMDTKSAVEEEWLLADVLLEVKYGYGSKASNKAEDLARISDVVSVHVKFQGLGYDEAVWDEPPPRNAEALWDAFYAAYEEFINGKYFPSARDQEMRARISRYRSLDFQKECELKSQPPCLRAGRMLMPYQMEGVNWLLYNFHQQQNVILADEMGLGKTIQIVSFISSLVQDQPKCWPFLVVVPNATCPNWRRELKDWAPGLRVVTYHGGKVAQQLAYSYELFPSGSNGGMKAHVVIMSFEAASTMEATLKAVKWAGLIVDEGQRLKNEQTHLYRSLMDMNIPCRILLTGTPLQNNKRELFNLIQFIDPKHNAEDLDAKYTELTKDNLPELHDLIRPYFLRRTKVEVLKFLPPMAQVIVPVTMTVLQEKLSKSIIARNPELIKAIISGGKMKAGDRRGLSNIIADLRQCLCHPFCFNDNVEDRTVGEDQLRRNLIEASPKLMLLEIMLPKLKARGHRLLIFSQFLRCLDVLEDFLSVLGLQYGRIDGSLSAHKKQRQIDAFNAPDSPLFAMLLSTRAGGVGINLATADTVIIYDPDWNPHQDIQAISRAHRIGQKEKVLCFQLTTTDTVEENIVQAGKKKLALDHALIETLDADNDSTNDIESILRRGAEALFSDKHKAKITYDAASVDKLLDRSRLESTSGDTRTTNKQFSIARVWANDSGILADNTNNTGGNGASTADASVWENILKARQEEHEREIAARQEVYGRGARRRNTREVDYNGRPKEPDSAGSDVDAEDELYIDNAADDDEDDAYGEKDKEKGKAMVPTKTKGAKAVGHGQAFDEARELAAIGPRPLKPPRKARQSQTSVVKTHQLTSQISATQQAQPTAQTRPLEPQTFSSRQNPLQISNFAASMLRGDSIIPTPRPFPNLTLPIPPSNVLRSTQTTLPATHRRPPNSPSGNVPMSSAGEGGTCIVCKGRHAPNKTCIDFSSEISLRIAIDSLRISSQPNAQAYRELLVRQLRQLTGR
ncbi:PHD/FYVE-zinc-finger like domain-containing protein [Hypoxylon crocopeplum]|nr:PHD/FYVE-zinc-finger like domain-containing protein [Hypoxylon crocopeplum]